MSSVVGEVEEHSDCGEDEGEDEPDLGLSATTGEVMLLRKSR